MLLSGDKPWLLLLFLFLGGFSIDLKSLQAQNAFNVIPPTSRATNYVVLRFFDIKAEPHVSFCESFHFIYFMRVNSLLILSKIQVSNPWH